MLPLPPYKCHASAADHAACRRILRQGSLSFHAASRLLPMSLRSPISSFYAFCRVADDGVDRSLDKRGALDRLKARLEAVYAGTPIEQPVDRAFADAVARYAIPRHALDLLFEGFEWDCEDRVYHSLSDVRAYGVRVAGTVGVVMAHFMGVRDADTLARAIDLGVAMQLTNIARDVGEDANAGRLYLPRDWMLEAGIDPDAFLEKPEISDALRSVIRRLTAEADRLYTLADSGISALGRGCRPAIFAARNIYHAIGGVVAKSNYDSVTARAVVGRQHKAYLVARSYIRALPSGHADRAAVLPEARDLLEETLVVQSGLPAVPTAIDRTIWALGILARESTARG